MVLETVVYNNLKMGSYKNPVLNDFLIELKIYRDKLIYILPLAFFLFRFKVIDLIGSMYITTYSECYFLIVQEVLYWDIDLLSEKKKHRQMSLYCFMRTIWCPINYRKYSVTNGRFHTYFFDSDMISYSFRSDSVLTGHS